MQGSTDTPFRVLIVDDNIDTAGSLSVLLRIWGYEVRTAHDGASAVEMARGFRPDAVVLDIGMPEMDGFEVASRLRALAEFEQTLIVGSSGYSREADRERAARVGINVYLVKPFDPWRLEAILDAHWATLEAIPA